jgi:peptide/nickel transport system ATP-binding protein
MALLEVESLSIGYHTDKGVLHAVEDVSFAVEHGRSLGLVGESGCGKTTIGMAILRLLPPNGEIIQGRIRFDGEDLLEKSPETMRRIRWKEIAMIFQAAMNALNPVHRVQDQIAEAIVTHEPQTPPETVQARVEALFDQVGIPRSRMRDFPHQYSGGMKQRAVIAMALALNPKLMIADEPTTALDVIVQDQILQAAKQIQNAYDIGMIYISHDIAVVAEVSHDIGVLYGGHLVEYGDREAVLESPMHPYTRLLLSSFLTVEGKKATKRHTPGDSPDLVAPSAGCRFCERCPYVESACRLEPVRYVAVSPTHRVLCSRCA